jgi:predicted TIM-barrel fold metal-dependent hydrolase
MTALYDGPIIDAHHHLWDRGSDRYEWLAEPRETVFGTTAPLLRDYLLDDYRADMASINLVKSVHIQASFDQDDPAAETRWLQGIADTEGFPHGIVAYSILEAPNAEASLEAHCAHANVRGIRQIMSWHKNPVWTFTDRSDLMQDEAWRRGFGLLRKHNLSFDMMIFSGQLGDVLDLARAFPDTQIILNHTGSPADRDDDGIKGWHDGMAALSQAPNVAVKISDLGAYDHNWTLESVRPFILHTIDVFGAERCMFASDFPVAGLHGGADAVYGSFKTLVADLSAAEQRALFHDNAVRLYRLD